MQKILDMKNQIPLMKFLVLFLAITWIMPAYSQISVGGTPPSFSFENRNEQLMSEINLPIDFDLDALRAEDANRHKEGKPPRLGTIIPVCFTTDNSGEWTTLPDGQDIWRLSIIAEEAIAIMLYYDKFEIPTGGKLFIYNNDRSQLLGAYTEANNPTRVEYATEFVAGDQIILEYVPLYSEKQDYLESPIYITGVCYGYNNLFTAKTEDGKTTVDVRAAGPCNVNVNCPEGNNWQDQKRGVARTTQRLGNSTYFCSGTVVNNAAGDLEPLFLTAYHCYFEGGAEANYSQTTFRFNYESPSCSNASVPTNQTLTGATKLVAIPVSGSADGMLLRITSDIPASYNVFYNGWDRRNVAATSGVSIHHPDGDIKKISTFTSPATSSSFQGPSGSAWRVVWVQTQTNHGVTEGGSSGSPLFNQDQRVVGTLSGGNASCTNQNGYDVYSKVWFHWNQHGTQ